MLLSAAVPQDYQSRVADVFVMVGNDATMTCGLPGFAAEFVSVAGWVTSEGRNVQWMTGGRYGNVPLCLPWR